MNRAVRIALATLGLLLLALVLFVLLGLVPAGTTAGTVLRVAGGGLMIGAAAIWGDHVGRIVRRGKR